MSSKRTWLTALILGATLAAAGPSAAGTRATADVKVRIQSSPGGLLPAALGQPEIFRILQGGTPALDAGLSQHLWRVAGSLAKRGWNPPRVTVRVVVQETEIRK